MPIRNLDRYARAQALMERDGLDARIVSGKIVPGISAMSIKTSPWANIFYQAKEKVPAPLS